MADYILAFQIIKHFIFMFLVQAEIGSIVPLGRRYFLMIPGTSCLATIVLSLRDKNHSPIAALRIIPALMGFNLSTLEPTALFPRDSRHSVPGYYRAVPRGQKPFARRSASAH